MLIPLLIMGAAYMFLFLALHLRAIRSEIEARRIHQMELARAGGV
jgi:hypothetical protein